MKGKLAQFKKSVVALISGVAFVLILWLLFFGKIKASEFLTPLINKIPKDQGKLTELTEKILGAAVQQVNSENVKKVTEKGSQIFEESAVAEPARDIRENVKQQVNQVIESVKELPAKEVRTIKQQVCKEWLDEIATESGSQ